MNKRLFVWRVASWFLPRSEIVSPLGLSVFLGVPPEPFLTKTVQAFQEVYALPPWNERWDSETVEAKLREEVRGGILVILLKEEKVAGLSWGAVISPKEVVPRVMASFPKKTEQVSQGLVEGLLPLLPERFFFWDEIALRPEARGGLESIRWLTLPLLQFALEQGVRSVVFRTTPEAKIVRFTCLLGFRSLWRRNVEETEELYLFLSDLRPVLTVATRANSCHVEKVMSLLSRRRRARG